MAEPHSPVAAGKGVEIINKSSDGARRSRKKGKCLQLCRTQEKVEVSEGRAAKQKLILGTHTSEGEQNYLMLAEVQLPTQDSEIDANGYDEESGEVGGYGAAAGKVQAGSKVIEHSELPYCRQEWRECSVRGSRFASLRREKRTEI